MRLIVEYVRGRAGDRGVRRLLQLAGRDAQRAASSATRASGARTRRRSPSSRPLRSCSTTRSSPGMSVRRRSRSGVGASTKALLRSLGSPAMVLRNLPRVTGKFSSVAIMEALEIERSRALIAYHVLPSGRAAPRRLPVQHRAALADRPALRASSVRRVVQYGCQAEGDRRCIYEVSWLGKAPAQRGRRRKASVLAAQLADLDATFDQVLSTAADLVSDDDVDTVLSRITERAAVAAHAPQFVLAVRPNDVDPLRVHHVGLTDAEVAQLVPSAHRPHAARRRPAAARRRRGLVAPPVRTPRGPLSRGAWVPRRRAPHARGLRTPCGGRPRRRDRVGRSARATPAPRRAARAVALACRGE